MKAIKITYWVATGLLAFAMTFSCYAYLTDEHIKSEFIRMGFPSYFRVELGIAKVIGSIILLVPISYRLKEWAYAGFGITFISALIGHLACGDPSSDIIRVSIFLIILFVSYYTYYKISENKTIK
jgi:VIT1/CCC1 family predicted Fe2+/Mn2+ transporter